MTHPRTGIHDLSISTTHYVLEHAILASHHRVPADKYRYGLGQEAMSVPAADEDIVTLAATAAAPILNRHGIDNLRTVLLATETGVDQSKAAGLYLHSLLGLPASCRIVELKQACYAATAALQFAVALVTRDPTQQVLVIAADIATYDLDTPAEATQGAAAAALLVCIDPAIAVIEPISGLYSADVMDFWRPNYRATPVVDAELSITAYLNAAENAWTDYRCRGGRALDEFVAFCYHQPFTKMAYKAHRHLLETQGFPAGVAVLDAAIGATTGYNRMIGNSYTASVYLALACLLDQAGDLSGQPIGLFSYGSGCVAEFFALAPVFGYREHLRTVANRDTIVARKPLDYGHYRNLHCDRTVTDGHRRLNPEETHAPYRLAALTDGKRTYQTAYHDETHWTTRIPVMDSGR
jgi:hydroxymethylglutaryl-CoA synthase